MAHTHGGDAKASSKASTKKHMSTSIERTIASYRNGHHATVYDIRRDPDLVNKDIIRDKNKVVFPFVGGSSYKGQWQADKKQGFGTEMNVEGGKYEGEWLDNKRHGRGTTFERRGGKSIRQYVGDWYNGNMEGEGVFYYPNGETYKGGWYRNLQSGQGRYDYANGDYYVGEWREGKQNGFGTLFIANGNTYEGLWMNGAKEGPGRFFYASTRKVYEGEWAEDQPRCGEYREPTAEEEATKFCAPTVRSQSFGLPELALADAKQVRHIHTQTHTHTHTHVYVCAAHIKIFTHTIMYTNEKLTHELLHTHTHTLSLSLS